jgi:heme exporter protein D
LLPADLQVPFHWFAPLMKLEVATHIYGSCVFGLGLPRYWLAMCYVPATLLSMTVCAAHNVLARKQFLKSLRREAASGAGQCAESSSK